MYPYFPHNDAHKHVSFLRRPIHKGTYADNHHRGAYDIKSSLHKRIVFAHQKALLVPN